MNAAIDALAWLAGDWKGEGEHSALEEHYSSAVGNTILGTSREVRDGVSVHREFLLFEQDGDGLRLTVIIPGRREIMFAYRGQTDGEHRFETSATPRERLGFRPLGSGRLHIRLQRDADNRSFDFFLSRTAG